MTHEELQAYIAMLGTTPSNKPRTSTNSTKSRTTTSSSKSTKRVSTKVTTTRDDDSDDRHVTTIPTDDDFVDAFDWEVKSKGFVCIKAKCWKSRACGYEYYEFYRVYVNDNGRKLTDRGYASKARLLKSGFAINERGKLEYIDIYEEDDD